MKLLLIAVAALALMVSGFLFVGGVSPAIVVAPEHVFDIGPVAVTNTMFTSWLVVLVLIAIGFITKSGLKLVPSGFAGGVEAAVEAFLGIVISVAGEKNGRRFFPLVATIFFFVLASNYFGLLPLNWIGKPEVGHGATQVVFQQSGSVAYIPLKPQSVYTAKGEAPILPAGFEAHGAPAGEHGAPAAPKGTEAAPAHKGAVIGVTEPVVSSNPAGVMAAAVAPAEAPHGAFSGALSPYIRSVNTDINAPLAIAIFSFLFVEFWGLQSLGPGYLKKFFAISALKKGPMGVIDIFVGVLEFVSELSRMVSFTFRLFGNVFAGEVLLTMMTFLVPFLLVDVFYGLELFVGLIQAFVFSILTLVFAVTAVSHHGDGEEHHAEQTEHHGAH